MVQIFVTEDNSNLLEIHLVDLTEYIYTYNRRSSA